MTPMSTNAMDKTDRRPNIRHYGIFQKSIFEKSDRQWFWR